MSDRPAWLAVVCRWHLLSLDAPCVAAAWLLTFCAAQPLRVRWTEAAALALAVWMLYVADRVLDARQGNAGQLQARHFFHARHARRFAWVAALLLPVLLVLVERLPTTVRAGWLWLAVPMGLYAVAIHFWPVRHMPKEMVVALMFAAATALPAMLAHAHPAMTRAHLQTAVVDGLFAAVCWLNGVAIARWELRAELRPASRSTIWGVHHLRAICAGVAVAGFALSAVVGWPALACMLSALLLLLLERASHRVKATTLRACADLTLLTPVLLLPFLR